MMFSYHNFLYLGTTLANLVMTPKPATCLCILSHMYKTKLRTAARDDGTVTQRHWGPPNYLETWSFDSMLITALSFAK